MHDIMLAIREINIVTTLCVSAIFVEKTRIPIMIWCTYLLLGFLRIVMYHDERFNCLF